MSALVLQARAPLMPAVMTGTALIALAVYFNLPYARLVAIFDYPDILRQPADAILTAFQDGGTGLILTWYGFAFAAILMMPVALAHAFAADRIARAPALAVSAAVIGVLAGLLQAMGLLRWVMVVPGLTASPDGAQGLALIHAYAGVALGEHLGMLLTAGHVGLVGALQWGEGRRRTAGLAALATAAITLGAFEGVALAMQAEGGVFALGSIGGYLLLTVWMVVSGIGMLRTR